MTTFTKRKQLALAIATICASPMLWAQSSAATDVGRIAVEGAQGGTATGLLVQEDTPKARSSVFPRTYGHAQHHSQPVSGD